jgi:branched-chain amino acid transport system substrate-binding protein
VKLVVLIALLAAAPAALAGSAANPGLTSKAIAIGSSGPLTGDAGGAAAVLRGADAYFKYVNARGGVNGRKIAFAIRDDAGDVAQAVENARALVEEPGVFALFSVVGDEANLAVRDYTTPRKVPVVFSAAGATTLGRDYGRFPYTIGYAPPVAAEAAVYAGYVLATTRKQARVAVLYDVDEGSALVAAVRRRLAGNQKLLVKAVPYDAATSDVATQVAGLRASGANTLFVLLPGAVAVDAVAEANRLGWRPQIYLGSAAAASVGSMPQRAVEGAISAVVAKDPAMSTWAKDPGSLLAGRIAAKYGKPAGATDARTVAGMAAAYSFVDALRRAGKTPTRDGLMQAVTHMNEASNPFLLPGIRVRTTPTSRFPIAQVALQRRHGGRWALVGGLQSSAA